MVSDGEGIGSVSRLGKESLIAAPPDVPMAPTFVCVPVVVEVSLGVVEQPAVSARAATESPIARILRLLESIMSSSQE